jgi:hypothetical protein
VVKLGRFQVTKPNYRGWPFALAMGLLLGILVLIDNGSVNTNVISSACRVEVTADVLSERASADPSSSSENDLHRGDVLGATTEVQGGYRKLTDGNWALDLYLRPLPGSKCAG